MSFPYSVVWSTGEYDAEQGRSYELRESGGGGGMCPHIFSVYNAPRCPTQNHAMNKEKVVHNAPYEKASSPVPPPPPPEKILATPLVTRYEM